MTADQKREKLADRRELARLIFTALREKTSWGKYWATPTKLRFAARKMAQMSCYQQQLIGPGFVRRAW